MDSAPHLSDPTRAHARSNEGMSLAVELGCVVLATLLEPTTLRAQPTIESLGAGTEPFAISAQGTVVTGGVSGSAFVWTRQAGLHIIGRPASTAQAHGVAVSSDGTIVAGTGSSSEASTGFRWTAQSGLQPLPISDATGISGDGLIVIGNAGGQPVRWTASGVTVLPGAGWTSMRALGVSGDGSTIVGTGRMESSVFAVRWSSDGSEPQSLGVTGAANAATPNGSVIVGTSDKWAFRWTSATGPQSLDESTHAGALCVSADGTTIGGHSVPIKGGVPNERALLWRQELGFVNLKAYLESKGLNLDGWILNELRGMSFDGRVMTGVGTREAAPEGWIITLAPPCYANCDGSTLPPVLSANDFACFLERFRSGDLSANCDGSTTPPLLSAADFTCFLSQFRAGCPWPLN